MYRSKVRGFFFQALRDILGVYSKKELWEKKFKSGKFDHLKGKRNPTVLKKVEKFSNGGKIVELGCGEGWLIFNLSDCFYSEYNGFDISDFAIANAISGAKERNLNKAHFYSMDISKWSGDFNVNVIIIEEVIYYLTKIDQVKLINVAFDSLCDGGILIITFHSHEKHRGSIENCLSNRNDMELISHGDSAILQLTK